MEIPESVLVVDNNLVKQFIPGDGPCLVTEGAMEIYSLILMNHTFVPRPEAEEDYTRKQAIPYVTVRHDGKYLLLQRTKKQSEKRLHNKMSLGIGGHINPGEDGGDDIIMNALRRELEEEVNVARPAGLTFAGIINDESNNVSKVHIGLLFILEAASNEFTVCEDELMTAEWATPEEIDTHYEALETWSQVVLDSHILNREPLGSR